MTTGAEAKGTVLTGEERERRRVKWEKRQEKKLQRKLEMAQRNDKEVISRTTEDTADFIRLIETADFLLRLIRINMGRKGKIDGMRGLELIARIETIKDELHLWNAEVSHELGANYRPPYGFVNPLAKGEQQAPG